MTKDELLTILEKAHPKDIFLNATPNCTVENAIDYLKDQPLDFDCELFNTENVQGPMIKLSECTRYSSTLAIRGGLQSTVNKYTGKESWKSIPDDFVMLHVLYKE